MKKKVLLITTKGCEACNIVKDLIQKALKIYGKEVEYEVKDKDEVDKKFLSTYHVTDFPSTLLIENDMVVFNFSGTRPAIIIARFMSVHFSR